MKDKFFSTLLLLFFFMVKTSAAQSVSLVSLDQLKQRFQSGKDTTYIINLWATWCAPCVKELPYFEQLQSNHSKEPVKVILLSTDFRSQLDNKVKPLVRKMKLHNEVFLADKKNDQDFIEGISKDWEGAIPGTLFVNHQKGLWQFYSQEFNYAELEKTYQSLK